MANDVDDAVRGNLQLVTKPEPLNRQGSEAEGDTGFEPPIRLDALVDNALERMQKRERGDEKPIPLPKSWAALGKEMHGGWWPEEAYVLVGNTGHGKTGFALQASLAAAKAGCPVVYVPLELNETQLGARLLGSETGAPWSALLYGEDKNALTSASGAKEAFRGLPFYVRRIGHRNATDFTQHVAWVREAEGDDKPMLVVLDFLQLMRQDGSDLRRSISDAAYAGTHIARNHNAAVLMLSSTARNHYEALDEKIAEKAAGFVGVGDASKLVGVGKETGEIEYAASNLLALCRDKPGQRFLGITKLRANKEPLWLKASFDGALGTFSFTPHPPPGRNAVDREAGQSGNAKGKARGNGGGRGAKQGTSDLI